MPRVSRSVRQLRTARFTAAVLLLFSTAPALAQRDLKEIPNPDPEVERKSFIVADGFEVNLFAGDPQMAKPIQMNFDAEGRLWIASSEVYPHIKPGQPATDRVLVVEDTDHDGKADKTTVFADGLLIPTGVVPGDGGAYVVNSTELLHFADTDGDLRADQRRIVLSGFGTEDTHHLLHTLRWGHDGCLYMNQSIYIHSHVETPYGVRHLNGGGIWRFRPETLQLEVFCRGFVNSWGHHFDAWGQSFATDGAYSEGINYVFPGSVFFTAVDAKRILHGLNPGSPKHCGLEILSGRHLPDSLQGNMITNDFRANRVCRFVVTEDGSAYASRQETELIKTNHLAFRPIDVKVGPDGAIYVADWYNPIIQHGEVDFRDPRRDHVHGRIWRITAKGRPTAPRPDWTRVSTRDLVERLAAPEDWVRLHAKLRLKTRDAEDVSSTLSAWLARLDPHDPSYEHHRLEALWLSQTRDEPNEELLAELLRSPDHRVRAAAVRALSTWLARVRNPLAYLRPAVTDEHGRVRLEAVRALAQIPSRDAAEVAITALDHPMDEFLDFAIWQTMRDLAPAWLPSLQAGEPVFGSNVAYLTFALNAVESPGVVGPLLTMVHEQRVPADRMDGVLALIATLGGADELGDVLRIVLDSKAALDDSHRAALLGTLVDQAQRRKVQPSGDLAAVANLLSSRSEPLRAVAARAAGAWKLEAMRERLLEAARQQDAPQSLRSAAIDALAALGGAASQSALAEMGSSRLPLADRKRALGALASLDVTQAAKGATQLLGSADEHAEVADLLTMIASQKSGPAALIGALDRVQLPADLVKLCIRAVRNSPQPSNELIATLMKAGGLTEAGWKLTPPLLDQLVAEVREKGDAHRGEQVYRRAQLQCMKCHAIGGAGGRVGPDLVSIGAAAPVDYLIEAIVEPNKKIKENYHSLQIETDEGRVVSGIPIRQSATEIVLRDVEDNQITIPVGSIDNKRDGRSLMPDGAVDALTRTELIDLTRFLSELGKVGDFAVGNARVVRRWESLTWTEEAHRRLNRTSFDTAATDDAALTWQPAYSTVGGQLPVDELPTFQPHPSFAPTSFVRCQIDVTTPGQVALQFGSPDGFELWIDGKPTLVKQRVEAKFARGRHTLTLAVNRKQRSTPLRVELVDVADSAAQAQIVGGK